MAEPRLSPEERALLGRSALFGGLSGARLDEALRFFSASRTEYPQGAVLLRCGSPVERFGLVLRGGVQAFMDDLNGRQLLLTAVGPGGTFGESLCWLGARESPVYIRAAEPSALLWLSASAAAGGGALTGRFLSLLARRALQMNDRIQILSRASLRDKLTAYFTICAREAGGDTFSVPFDRSGMAAYLGTERSALSRELSRMRREGLIDFYKSSFRLFKARSETPDTAPR